MRKVGTEAGLTSDEEVLEDEEGGYGGWANQ